MKTILGIAVLFLLCVSVVCAQTYRTYRIGTDVSDDYATFAAYRVAHPTDSAGDTISFRKGQTFNESITINASGTSRNVITITAHGTGSKPIINPAHIIKSWTGPDAYGVYTAITTGYSAEFAFEDGIPIKVGTLPALDAGTWYKSGNTFSYRPSMGVPGDHIVRYIYHTSGGEAGVLPQGISVSNRSYITIDGVRIDNCIGVNGQLISNITVKNCDFYYNPVRAIQFWGNGTIGPVLVENNYFYRVFAGAYAGLHPDYTGGHEVVCSGITFSNNTLVDTGTPDGGTTSWWSYGINVSGYDIETISGQNIQGSTWSGNTIIGGTAPGPMMYTFPTGTTSGNTITRNFIYNTTGAGIKLQGDGAGAINNNMISYNIFSKIGVQNETNLAYFEYMAVTGSTQMNYFYNNTLYIPASRVNQYVIYLYSLTPGNYRYMTIKNNLISCPSTGFLVWARNGSGNDFDTTVVIDNNLYSDTSGIRWNIAGTSYNFANWKGLGYDTHPTTNGTDPLFVNASISYSLASDFRLRSGSPAINAGRDVGFFVDYDSVPISGNPDIGVYEYQPIIQPPKHLRIVE